MNERSLSQNSWRFYPTFERAIDRTTTIVGTADAGRGRHADHGSTCIRSHARTEIPARDWVPRHHGDGNENNSIPLLLGIVSLSVTGSAYARECKGVNFVGQAQVDGQASGTKTARAVHRPPLLSDNGSSYLAADLAKWLDDRKIQHVRGAPYHPQIRGKIERWHQTLKNRILLENYDLLGDLETQICDFVSYYNHLRYYESIANSTPADFGRDQTILLEKKGSNGKPSRTDA